MEIKVWKNRSEGSWEVRVLVGRRLYGRLFHYKKEAEIYAKELSKAGTLENELGDPAGLRLIKEVI